MSAREQASPAVRVEVLGLPDGCPRALEEALERRLGRAGVRVSAGGAAGAGAPGGADVLVAGPGADGAEAARWIAEAGATAAAAGGAAPAAIVVGFGAELRPFERLLASDRLWFVAPGVPDAEAVAELVVAAAERDAEPPADPEAVAALLSLERELAAAGRPAEVAARLAATLPRLVPEIVAARCLRYDRAAGTLVDEPTAEGALRVRHSAASGLVAFAARTGRRLSLERPERDPRHDPEVDRVEGSGLTVLPITGAGDRVLAVLAVGWRRPLPPMGERRLEAAAGRAGHALARLELESSFAAATRGSPVFRPAALEAQARGSETDGTLLTLDPRWIRWTYRLLVALLVAVGLYLLLGTHREVVSGPAVVRLDAAGGPARVVGFLPGPSRPMLGPDTPLRLRLDGFPQATTAVGPGRLGDSIVGPREALRRLPSGLASSIELAGPSLVVEAALPASGFVAGGRRYRYFDGMTGTLEAVVGEERLLFSLVPGLRSLAVFEEGGDGDGDGDGGAGGSGETS